MTYDFDPVRQVSTQYGERTTGGAVGTDHTQNHKKSLEVELTGKSLLDGFVPPHILPEGAKVVEAWLTVSEAINFGGATTVTIQDESGNGTLPLTDAELSAVDTIDVSGLLTGDWQASSYVTENGKIAIDQVGSGPEPVSGDLRNGLAKVVIYYVDAKITQSRAVPDPGPA